MSGSRMVTYLDSTYQETLSLIKEARDYIASGTRARHAWLAPEARLQICCESMRLTARLTQVMAWLMMQRAVQSGEVPVEEAAKPENRLSGQVVCGHVQSTPEGTDQKMQDLLGRSHALYVRIARLDSQLDRT
ncbi:DUF1465 family protein [Kiloniella laminariae]|uniref:DUF1465 family protein n=2 Tax=Kiloniella laminariae TaxID=454162 RepID=A0ABT4LIA6_9PROT|nr:DUF1465 family protein [Kiloniella laminariae]